MANVLLSLRFPKLEHRDDLFYNTNAGNQEKTQNENNRNANYDRAAFFWGCLISWTNHKGAKTSSHQEAFESSRLCSFMAKPILLDTLSFFSTAGGKFCG
jgi:hypothetical protein